MNAHVRLVDYDRSRQHSRYIFRRRGLMTVGTTTILIHTLDVSVQGMGVIGSLALRSGTSCVITLDVLLGARVVHLTFSCKVLHCILAGTEGFRSSLYIDDGVESHQQQLQKIIAACSALSL